METAKEKCIKEAYINLIGIDEYDKIKHAINNDGSVHNLVSDLINEVMGFEHLRLVYWRPKSLQGLEDNNGWISIEPDGSNLPTDDIEYWCIEKASGDLTVSNLLNHNKKFSTCHFSHYQPIVKPLKPLY